VLVSVPHLRARHCLLVPTHVREHFHVPLLNCLVIPNDIAQRVCTLRRRLSVRSVSGSPARLFSPRVLRSSILLVFLLVYKHMHLDKSSRHLLPTHLTRKQVCQLRPRGCGMRHHHLHSNTLLSMRRGIHHVRSSEITRVPPRRNRHRSGTSRRWSMRFLNSSSIVKSARRSTNLALMTP
jgi:hypothetical protein